MTTRLPRPQGRRLLLKLVTPNWQFAQRNSSIAGEAQNSAWVAGADRDQIEAIQFHPSAVTATELSCVALSHRSLLLSMQAKRLCSVQGQEHVGKLQNIPSRLLRSPSTAGTFIMNTVSGRLAIAKLACVFAPHF
jgi:hypothetical protein